MENTNFTFMVYGFAAAWLILFAYVALLAARERRLEEGDREPQADAGGAVKEVNCPSGPTLTTRDVSP